MSGLEGLLPPGLGLKTALLLILTSGATSFLTAAVGIGGGAVLLAVMAQVMPTAALIPVHGVVQLGSNAGRLVALRKYAQTSMMLPFLAGSIAGAALGGSVAVSLPAWAVQGGLSCFILLSVWGARLGLRRGHLGGKGLVVGGAISTFLTMLFGATGPFVSTLLRARALERMAQVATLSLLMVVQNSLKLIVFAVLGFAFAPWLPLMVAMIVLGFGGTLLGRTLLLRTGDGRFFLMLDVLLTLLALRLLVQAAQGFG